MKKTYMSPETSLLLVRTQNLMGASQNPEGFNSKPEDENPIDPNDMLSRRRSQWDDLEEEEEEW